jgi:hypothetical protein
MVTVKFLKQKRDFKEISRTLRNSKVFGKYVVSKSKDRRTITLDFDNEETGFILEKLFFDSLKELEIAYEV